MGTNSRLGTYLNKYGNQIGAPGITLQATANNYCKLLYSPTNLHNANWDQKEEFQVVVTQGI